MNLFGLENLSVSPANLMASLSFVKRDSLDTKSRIFVSVVFVFCITLLLFFECCFRKLMLAGSRLPCARSYLRHTRNRKLITSSLTLRRDKFRQRNHPPRE